MHRWENMFKSEIFEKKSKSSFLLRWSQQCISGRWTWWVQPYWRFQSCLPATANLRSYDGQSDNRFNCFINYYHTFLKVSHLNLIKAFEKYFDNDIPTFLIAGNHDMSENPTVKHVRPFQMTFGEPYYHFQFGNRGKL